MKGHLYKKPFRNKFGKFSVIVSAIDSWNKMQGQMSEIALKNIWQSKIKWLLTDKFVKSYLLFFYFFIEFCLFSVNLWIGIVLFYLLTLFSSTHKSNFFFWKIRAIALVLARIQEMSSDYLIPCNLSIYFSLILIYLFR